MPNLSSNRFEKSLKNYKIFFNGILIVNLILSVFYVIGTIIIPILYNNDIIVGYSTYILRIIEEYASFIPGPIAIISFILYFFISNFISKKILDYRLKDNFRSIRSLNIFSFILLILVFYPIFIFFYIWGSIIFLVLFAKSYFKLKKKEIYMVLRKDCILGLISYVIGGLLSFLLFNFYRFRIYDLTIGPPFVLIGIALMNRKVVPYFSLKNSENLSHLEKTQQILPQNKLYGQISESQIKPVQEINVVNAEYEPEFGKISNKSTQEDVVEQIIQSNNQPEIIIEEEIPKQQFESTITKAETKPEIVIQPELIFEEDITQKKISEKPIQNKRILKDDIFKVSKKICPFCGKKHDDLTVTFCHACGYKF